MGAYFSNLHIKKESVSEEDVKAELLACFAENGCTPSDSDTADFEVCLYAPADGRWLSVYCDTFECLFLVTSDFLTQNNHSFRHNTNVIIMPCRKKAFRQFQHSRFVSRKMTFLPSNQPLFSIGKSQSPPSASRAL